MGAANILTREEAAEFLYYVLTLPSSATLQFADAIEGRGAAGEFLRNAGLDELAAELDGCQGLAGMIRELAEKKKRCEERARLGLTYQGRKQPAKKIKSTKSTKPT